MNVYCYTLAPVSHSPESLSARFPRPMTLAAWNRYGSYCPNTVPAFIVTYRALPTFNIDISEAQIITIDSESDVPPASQALRAIGLYLFDPAADKPIVIEQIIGDAMHKSPAFRVIDFQYEDSIEGKAALETDCLTATSINLDLRKSLTSLKQEAWSAVKTTLSAEEKL